MADRVSNAVSHKNHRERVRARIRANGLETLLPHEILEYMLFPFVVRKDTKPMAYKLLERFGSLPAVLEADPADLAAAVPEISANAALFLTSLLPMLRVYYREKWGERPLLNGARVASEYVVNLYIGISRETFYLLCLDASSRLIHAERLCEGTLDALPTYTRSVAEVAIRCHAAQLILCHNHPGGSPTPSTSDIVATRQILNALAGIGVNVLDHIIIAGDQYCSLSSERLIPAPEDNLAVAGMGMFAQSWRDGSGYHAVFAGAEPPDGEAERRLPESAAKP